jgi:hypothetical protein
MSNLKQKHKDYLIKNEIKDLTDLVNYVEILRNTSNLQGEDRQMLFDFAFLIVNEQSSLKSFFAENKNPSKVFYNAFKKSSENENIYERIRVNFYRYLDDNIPCIVVAEFNSLENAKVFFRKYPALTEAFYYTYATNELLEKEEKSESSPTFIDEVINDLQDREELITVQVPVGALIVPKEEQVFWAKKILKENKTETSTEIPNFTPIDVEKIFPKHAFDTIEKQNGEKETEGVKLDSKKPKIALLFKQFPKALEAIARCSEYGHEKYKDTDSDYLNFKRVKEGSEAYANAGLRHRLQQGIDLESMLPHRYHVAWNALAELELLLEDK